MSRLIVFGATGGIGSRVVKAALDAGHEVTAIVRHPELLTIKHPALEVVKGDVLIPETLKCEMESSDAVVSAIGVRNTKPTVLYSEGIGNIIGAMKNACVSRLVCVSALPVEGVTPGMPLIMKIPTKFILLPLLKDNYADALRMEKRVEASGLKWTIVRPPRLTNRKGTGKYRISIGGHLKSPWSLSRSDVADFIVGHLDDDSSFGKKVEIAN